MLDFDPTNSLHEAATVGNMREGFPLAHTQDEANRGENGFAINIEQPAENGAHRLGEHILDTVAPDAIQD